ncbi:MAG TPA: peptide transporter, partial [Polyangia bacterium]|nr:peptide transporter [Polyangia bacterium]
IRDLGHLPPYKLVALGIGLGIGFLTQVARRLLARSARWRAATGPGGRWFAAGWVVDSVLLPSPYASSFGGFVELATSVWFSVGGALASAEAMLERRRRARLAARAPGGDAEVLPEDMSTTSLVGGGLIAGESLYTLAIGIISLLSLRR